jgi:hypothetical protein
MFSHIHPFLWPPPRLGYLAGVVPKVDEARFARALWRAARGNTFAWHGGTGCAVGDGPWDFWCFTWGFCDAKSMKLHHWVLSNSCIYDFPASP